jgi:hypothetical protein
VHSKVQPALERDTSGEETEAAVGVAERVRPRLDARSRWSSRERGRGADGTLPRVGAGRGGCGDFDELSSRLADEESSSRVLGGAKGMVGR